MHKVTGIVEKDILDQYPGDAPLIMKKNIERQLLKAERGDELPMIGIVKEGEELQGIDPDAPLDPRIEWEGGFTPDGDYYMTGTLE